jgi:hypothetical protein
MTGRLSFVWTPWSITIGVVMVLVTFVLCVMGWRRGGYAPRAGLLELLRLVIVAMVAVTINQPEWLVEYVPKERPTVVILQDNTGSMKTADMATGEGSAAELETRAAWASRLTHRSRWAAVQENLEVIVEPFSSSLASPTDGTDLHAAIAGAADDHPNLRAVVVISDGDWNTGEPPIRAASQLKIKGIPVHCIGVGSSTQLPDIDLVRVDAPTFGVVGKPLRIPLVIDCMLPRENEVTVTLTPSSGEEVSQTITLPAMSRVEETVLWTPEETGDFELTVRVPEDADELVKENNQRVVPISVREEALKVLLVESLPRWEYRYLRNALQRDPGVEVSCLLFLPGLSKPGGGRDYIKAFPSTMDELSHYDVVFLGDVGVGDGQLSVEQCRLLRGLVEGQASGLIFMPGVMGRHLSFVGTDLESLYPVQLDPSQPRGWGSRAPSQMELTSVGRRSLLTRLEDSEDANAQLWETLPGFQWYAAVERAKVNSQVLAMHKSQRVPLLVTKTAGTGKVLFMGTDGAWRWREGVEDKYHYRFWGQVARWMAYQRSMAAGESMRLYYTPDRPQAGDRVTFYANVSGAGGEPLQRGTVILRVTTPGGEKESVRLLSSGDEWGLFTNSFQPEEWGSYELTLECRENGASLEAQLDVQGTELERVGRPARFEVLQEIADVTGGKLVEPDELTAVVTAIADLPEPSAEVRRLRLWCHPIWTGLLVFLMTLFWVGRKMVGAI